MENQLTMPFSFKCSEARMSKNMKFIRHMSFVYTKKKTLLSLL